MGAPEILRIWVGGCRGVKSIPRQIAAQVLSNPSEVVRGMMSGLWDFGGSLARCPWLMGHLAPSRLDVADVCARLCCDKVPRCVGLFCGKI